MAPSSGNPLTGPGNVPSPVVSVGMKKTALGIPKPIGGMPENGMLTDRTSGMPQSDGGIPMVPGVDVRPGSIAQGQKSNRPG